MRFRVLLALLPVVIFPVTSHAQWVQDGRALCNAPLLQNYPTAVSDGAGGAIITWMDQRTAVADIYAQRVDGAGNPKWTSDGVVICNAASVQFLPTIASDGAGGAIIAWYDLRNGTYDVYAQRINSAGTILWTPNGVAVNNFAFDQTNPTIVSDGSNGAVIAWQDNRSGNNDIYGQRLNPMGGLMWPAGGVAFSTAAGAQQTLQLASDGAGGAIAVWEDSRIAPTDVYAQRVNSAGVAQWLANGVSVCSAANIQTVPMIVADGAGGAVITWNDYRGSSADIYAQRLNASGAAQWGTDGFAVCTNSSAQNNPVVSWDNTTGAIVAWHDFRNGAADIFAQRVTGTGSLVWTTDGVVVSAANNGQTSASIVPDGTGGAVVAWSDARNALFGQIYAQRIDSSGFAKWTTDGMPVCTSPSAATPFSVVTDGNGGALLAWSDQRAGANSDIYAQHIDGRFGYWGKPDPVLFAVKDVPADQGGKVRLEWYASGRDQLNQQAISYYSIWRAIDQAAYATASQSGVPEVKLSDVGSSFKGAAIRREKSAATEYFWELIGQQDAIYRYAYSFTASTNFDSTAANAATHHFQVVAHTSSQYINWPSNVLTGRSVDNLAPPAPLFLTAQRTGHGSDVGLKWNGVHVKDLDKYTVYRGTASGVTPIPANFLANDNDTLLVDLGAPTTALYYIVTATDIHQNQGAKSNEAAVSGATGVGNTPALTALTVLQNHPNPFTGETQIQVGLPAGGDVRVEIYDVAGRRVRNVLVPAQEKGWDTLRISARDDRGMALASGVYFFRVHAGKETVTRKMVIAR